MRTAIVIITENVVEQRVLDAVAAQTVNAELIVHIQPATSRHPNPVQRLYRNCSKNRESARRQALQTNADGFLFLDSDVVIPPNAVDELSRQSLASPPIRTQSRVVAGWYGLRNDPYHRFVAGLWVANDTFCHYDYVQTGVVQTNLVGLGCAYVPRDILTQIKFRHGCEKICISAFEPDTRPYVGECGAFSSDVEDAGFHCFMCGDVVCEHIDRSPFADPAPAPRRVRRRKVA